MDLKIYQIYFDEVSENNLLKGFTPVDNKYRGKPYYENGVIYDVYKNRRNEWVNADYVGIVSWRFKEKTKLNFDLISDFIEKDEVKKDVYFMTPPMFMSFKSPIGRYGHPNVNCIAKIADKEELFPFKLYDYNIGQYVNFCNYFLVTPLVFEIYCKHYLEKTMDWLERKESAELRMALTRMYPHRNKEPYPVHPMFLEGLFPVFAHRERLSYEHILKKID